MIFPYFQKNPLQKNCGRYIPGEQMEDFDCMKRNKVKRIHHVEVIHNVLINQFHIKEDCPEDGIIPHYASDRFGSNFEQMITIYVYAKLIEKPFCINPWVHSFEDSLDYFLWIGGQNYGDFPKTEHKKETYSHNVKYLTHGKMHQFQKEIRKFYFSSSKPVFDEHFKYVLHIRRGDINAKTIDPYYEPFSRIAQCITKVKDGHPKMDVIHVFSQGKKKMFQTLLRKVGRELNFKFHLDEDLKETFHRMVLANVLILGRSTLSWSAGYLNKDGEIYSTYDDLGINNGIYASDIVGWKGKC